MGKPTRLTSTVRVFKTVTVQLKIVTHQIDIYQASISKVEELNKNVALTKFLFSTLQSTR